MSDAQVKLDGRSSFELITRLVFPGLDIEYKSPFYGEVPVPCLDEEEDDKEPVVPEPPLVTQDQCAKLIKSLGEVEYVNIVASPGLAVDKNVGYAWFSDKGEWLLSLDKRQENAFVPFSYPGWLRGISWSISERTPSFRARGTGMIGGGNVALVTWLSQPGATPLPRLGQNFCKWVADMPLTTIFLYVGSDEGAELVFTPSKDLTSVNFFRDVKAKNPSSFSVSLHSGSILILRGRESHYHWDVTCQNTLETEGGGGGYLIYFQTVAPLAVHREHAERPPTRTRRGISEQIRVIPSLRGVDEPIPEKKPEEEEEEQEERRGRPKNPIKRIKKSKK